MVVIDMWSEKSRLNLIDFLQDIYDLMVNKVSLADGCTLYSTELVIGRSRVQCKSKAPLFP